MINLETHLRLLDGVLNTNGSENVERRSAGEPGPVRTFLSRSISTRVVYSNLMETELANTDIDGYCAGVHWQLNERRENAASNELKKSKPYYRGSQIGKYAIFTVYLGDIRRMSIIIMDRVFGKLNCIEFRINGAQLFTENVQNRSKLMFIQRVHCLVETHRRRSRFLELLFSSVIRIQLSRHPSQPEFL